MRSERQYAMPSYVLGVGGASAVILALLAMALPVSERTGVALIAAAAGCALAAIAFVLWEASAAHRLGDRAHAGDGQAAALLQQRARGLLGHGVHGQEAELLNARR